MLVCWLTSYSYVYSWQSQHIRLSIYVDSLIQNPFFLLARNICTYPFKVVPAAWTSTAWALGRGNIYHYCFAYTCSEVIRIPWITCLVFLFFWHSQFFEFLKNVLIFFFGGFRLKCFSKSYIRISNWSGSWGLFVGTVACAPCILKIMG